MTDTKLTDEFKQLLRSWRLLVGLVNESLSIIHSAWITPEERLRQLRERLEFAQQFTRELPPSVRAELDADPAVKAVLATITCQDTELPAARYVVVMDDDGTFREAVEVQKPGERLLSDSEVQALLGESGMA